MISPNAPSLLIPTTAGAAVVTSDRFNIGTGLNCAIRVTGGVLGAGESVVISYVDIGADYTVNPPTGGVEVPLVDAITGAATIGENESSITIAMAGWYVAEMTLVGSTRGLELAGNNAS